MFSASRLPRRALGVLRLPVLLLIAAGAAMNYHVLVGGTGGLDPWWIEADEDGPRRSIAWSYFFVRGLGPAMGVLLSLAIVAVVIRAGRKTALGGLRFLLGLGRPENDPAAAEAIALGARVVTWGGLILGVAAAGVNAVIVFVRRVFQFTGGEYYVDEWDEFATPTELLRHIHRNIDYWSELAPFVGLVLGRIVLGALADAARARSTAPVTPAFARRHDVWLIVTAILMAYRCLPFSRYTPW